MADIIWTKVQVVLTDVPIEYMDCNSDAFADLDDVIVEFTGQDWDQPKIIGFKENPKICSNVYVFPGFVQARYEEKSLTMRLSYLSESWAWKATFSRDYEFYALPGLPFSGSASRGDYAATGEGGIGFTLGGRSFSEFFAGYHFFNHLDLFDSVAETFSAGRGHAEEKASLIFESIGEGKCISQGGMRWALGVNPYAPGSSGTVYDSTHRYTISTGTWETAEKGEAVFDQGSFVIDGRLYLVGGTKILGRPFGPTRTTKTYFNEFNTWQNFATCPETNYLRVNGYNLGGKGLVGGGALVYDGNPVSLIDTTREQYLYDANTLTWTQKAGGRSSFGQQATATALSETVALQFSGGGAGTATHWLDYVLETDTFSDRGVFGLTVSNDPIWYSHRQNASGVEL